MNKTNNTHFIKSSVIKVNFKIWQLTHEIRSTKCGFLLQVFVVTLSKTYIVVIMPF